METAIIGLVLLVAAGAAAFYGRSLHATTALMDATPTTPCGKIRTAGFYEVNGVVECDNPMKLPEFDIACVWWRVRVEERIRERSSSGHGHGHTRWRVVEERSERRPFRVTDRSGSVAVAPKGAEMDGATKSWEQGKTPGILTALLGGRRVEGERTTVEYLETGRRVYLIGRVEKAAGEPCFVEGGPEFIISSRSEEELKSSKGMWATLALVGAALLGIAGLIVLVRAFGR